MKRVAGAMLAFMAALLLLAHIADDGAAHWGYVRAFAEAALVGGLADWFAVTALFRHPLGLPIPHTAIIARNKDRIGDALASFLRGNFLTPAVVARRTVRWDVAGTAVRFLNRPAAVPGGRLRQAGSALMADMLDALDHQRLGAMVRSALGARVSRLDLAPLLGQAMDAAMREGRHGPVMDALILWTGRALHENEQLIRDMVSEKSGKLLRWTGLDETLATAILDGLIKLVDDMRNDTAHPLRRRVEDGLQMFAHKLRHDPHMRARVAAVRDELMANPAMQAWMEGMWEQARQALLRAARDPQAAMAGRLGEAMARIGATIESDVRLRAGINRFVRRALVVLAARYGEAIVRLVSDTVRGWDARTVTARIEQTVGRDLQYIRINGTLVGGVIGVVIHVIERALI